MGKSTSLPCQTLAKIDVGIFDDVATIGEECLCIERVHVGGDKTSKLTKVCEPYEQPGHPRHIKHKSKPSITMPNTVNPRSERCFKNNILCQKQESQVCYTESDIQCTACELISRVSIKSSLKLMINVGTSIYPYSFFFYGAYDILGYGPIVNHNSCQQNISYGNLNHDAVEIMPDDYMYIVMDLTEQEVLKQTPIKISIENFKISDNTESSVQSINVPFPAGLYFLFAKGSDIENALVVVNSKMDYSSSKQIFKQGKEKQMIIANQKYVFSPDFESDAESDPSQSIEATVSDSIKPLNCNQNEHGQRYTSENKEITFSSKESRLSAKVTADDQLSIDYERQPSNYAISADNETDSEVERFMCSVRHKRMTGFIPPYRQEIYTDYIWEYDIRSDISSLVDAPRWSKHEADPYVKRYENMTTSQIVTLNRRNEITDTSSEDSHLSLHQT